MVCIHCGQKTHVTNSRLQRRSNQVWRRRACLSCGAIFTTEETAQYDKGWVVRHPSGPLQPFSRDKLLLSLYASCQHRKTALQDAGALVDTVIGKLMAKDAAGVLLSKDIARVAQVALNRFDTAASVHYRAFHS